MRGGVSGARSRSYFKLRGERAQPSEAQRELSASPEDFTHCNGCPYIFKKREAQIDMRDFREHKQHCSGMLPQAQN